MMRIGIDARCITAPQLTGIERMVLRILEQWPADGPECIVYVDTPIPWDLPRCVVRVLRAPHPAWWFRISLPRAIRHDRINTFVSPVTILPWMLPRKITKAVIVHDLGYLAYPQFYNTQELRILNGKVQRSILTSDIVIADSQFTATEIVSRLKVPAERIHPIQLAMDPPIQSPALPNNFTPNRPFLLTVGTAYGRKNLSIIVPVLKLLSEQYHVDINVIMTGKKGFAEQAILDEAQTQGVGTRIHHLGFVTEEEKAGLMRNASVFFFPSLYEGFGIPVLEAMQYGCPVVCANTSSLPEVAGDGALVFNPHNPRAAADAINRIISDTAIRNRVIENGTRNLTRFSWERTASQFVDALSSSEPTQRVSEIRTRPGN